MLGHLQSKHYNNKQKTRQSSPLEIFFRYMYLYKISYIKVEHLSS